MKINGKKILVTGAAGFIGSHLTEHLVEQGAQVRAMVHYNSANSIGWLEKSKIRDQIEIFPGDIRDGNSCEKAVEGQEIIFHLAALIAIPYSYQAPDSYIETNIKGTSNICLSAKRRGVEKIIITSTSEVYGSAKSVPITESHPLQPQSPYSASKVGADAIALSYRDSFDLPIVIARPFNTFGPRQSTRAIIPTLITQILKNNGHLEIGATHTTRDFNFVENTCQGFRLLAELDQIPETPIHFGSGVETSIQDLISLLQKITGVQVEIKSSQERFRPNKSEVLRLLADNSKINQLTGYQPLVSLEEGLIKNLEWYSKPENLSLFSGRGYTV